MAGSRFRIRIPIALDSSITAEVDILIRSLMHKAMTEVGLPTAREKAPGSIGPQIRILPIKFRDGKYSMGLSMPGQYKWVEVGSGIFADHQPWDLTADDRKGKGFKMPWGYRASAVDIQGQPGQEFLAQGISAAEGAFYQWFPQHLLKLLRSPY